MSAEIRALKEQRADLFAKAKALDTSTPEKRAEAEKMLADVEALGDRINTEERKERLAGEFGEPARPGISQPNRRDSDKITDRDRTLAFRAWCAGDKAELVTDEMRNAAKKCKVNYRAPSFRLGSLEENRATSDPMGWGAGTTGANQVVSTGVGAGPMVPAIGGLGTEIEKVMAAYGGVREACRVIKTQSGANFMYPVVDESTVVGKLLAENTQATVHTFASTYVEFKAHKFTSNIVRVSLETLQDTQYPFEAILAEMLGERIARRQNYYFTVGASSNGAQPDGIVGGSTAADTSRVSGLGVAGGIAYNSSDLMSLFHAVDPNYRRNGTWMFNDATLLALKAATILTTFYYPIWQPSIREGEPDTLMGKPYVINQDMPSFPGSSDSGNKPIAFGDLSKQIIRDALGITLVRFNEKYLDYYEAGFAAFARADSHCVNSNAIKHWACSAASS